MKQQEIEVLEDASELPTEVMNAVDEALYADVIERYANENYYDYVGIGHQVAYDLGYRVKAWER